MKKEVLELIKYRLEEAEDFIKEAEVLLKEGMSTRAVAENAWYETC
jgi:ribosomal protein L7/L12